MRAESPNCWGGAPSDVAFAKSRKCNVLNFGNDQLTQPDSAGEERGQSQKDGRGGVSGIRYDSLRALV